jgi:hypothetical protein
MMKEKKQGEGPFLMDRMCALDQNLPGSAPSSFVWLVFPTAFFDEKHLTVLLPSLLSSPFFAFSLSRSPLTNGVDDGSRQTVNPAAQPESPLDLYSHAFP